MEDKNAQNAVEIIYRLPSKLNEILDEVRALKTRNAMLEAKLNGVSVELAKVRSELSAGQHAVPAVAAPAATPVVTQEPAESEVMDAVTAAPPLPSRAAPGAKGGPASLPQKLTIPAQDVDPLKSSSASTGHVPANKAATHVKGRVKDRDGAGAAGIEVKVMTLDNNLVKKTKTSAGGTWLAFLQPGEYTVECTKPGQRSPMFKSLIIQEGQREVELVL